MRKVYGKGINDSPTLVRKTAFVEGKTVQLWICPFYNVWMQMLIRCFSSAYRGKYTFTYESKVCDDWLTFSKFKGWMETQDFVGKQPDKDILISDNKEYSPKTCLFVSQDLNKFFNLHKNRRSNTLIGVTKNSRGERYTACITLKGKTKSLGGFHSPEEAHREWIRNKILALHEFITYDGSRLDERLQSIEKSMQSHYDERTIFTNY